MKLSQINMERFYKITKLILHILAIFSVVEIFCIEYHIALIIINPSLVHIISNISYAYIVTYIFYIIVVFIPEIRNKYHYKDIISLRLGFLINSLLAIRNKLIKDSNINNIDSIENIKIAFDIIAKKKKLEFYKYYKSHITDLTQQLFHFYLYIDAYTLSLINDIFDYNRQLTYGIEIKDQTLGATNGKEMYNLLNTYYKLKTIYENEYKKD